MTADLSQTILAKSDQLNSDDLMGRTITIKITKVDVAVSEQPVAINYEGDNGKPWRPGKSMRRVLSYIWGTDGKVYVGRQLTLYRDPNVKFGGLEVGGIRISHMSHIDKPVTMALTASKANKKPFTVKPLETVTAPSINQGLKDAGTEAAGGGVESYTTWRDALSDEEKAAIKPLNAGWSKDAKAADAGKGEEELAV